MAYLQGLLRFGMRPGLERIRELLTRLGEPHRAGHRIVHIGGTNGKGSTSAFVAAGLQAAGCKVGLYTSPELECWNERIRFCGDPILDVDVADLVATVRPHMEAMVAAGHEQPTEFEMATALAFLYFTRRAADWVVLEAGLGVRYDTTNVVEQPHVTCLTSVDLDHTDILGSTYTDIAADKSAICKPSVPCVFAVRDPQARAQVRRAAAAVGAPLVEVVPPQPVAATLAGQEFNLPGYPGLWIRLLGRHQLVNAACAVKVLECCGVSPEAIREGLSVTRWPGRFEVLRDHPPLILDCAHNAAATAALVETWQTLVPNSRPIVVLGVLADKDLHAIASLLLPLASRIFVTTPAHPKRALCADTLAAHLSAVARPPAAIPVHVEPDISRALGLALAESGTTVPVLVTGSTYLVGPARRFLQTNLGR